MKLKVYLVTLVLLLFSVGAASAAPAETCKNGKWIGSYTQSVNVGAKKFIYQYNFNADGTLVIYFSGYPELPNTTGTGTPSFGSWECRNDGHIIATFLYATYNPTGNDTVLNSHIRQTSELVIVDRNTLNRIKTNFRDYDPSEDPADPDGGTLGVPSTTVGIYKRVLVNAGDLN